MREGVFIGAARDSGSAGTEDTRGFMSAKVVGPWAHGTPHRRCRGHSLPPHHFKPQEAALLCSPVPLPHSGAAQAREGCIVGVLKEPAPRKTVQGICPDLSALIQARVTCSPSQPECRAPRGEGRCPEFTQQVQVELGTYLGVCSSDS